MIIGEDSAYANSIDRLIGSCSEELIAGRYDKAAEGLQELCYTFARAGLGMESFGNMRRYIINQAKQCVDSELLMEYELEQQEKKLRQKRGLYSGVTRH